jgi:hypothetical protein
MTAGREHHRASAMLRFKRWLWLAILVGVVYIAVGIGFAALAKGAASAQMQFTWRLAAWVVSAVAFAIHILYEQFRLRSSPTATALHAALAAALGAFGLAVAANVHRHFVPTSDEHARAVTLAMVIWPMITALPAFVVALAAAAIVAFRRRGD